MVAPPRAFREIAKDFVCVRVTDMMDVDLSVFRFDYDLTFAALLMHPDGTIYHRFGGRNVEDPLGWSSVEALLRVMRTTLDEHAKYLRDPKPPMGLEKGTIKDIPPFARKMREKKIECAHCHMIHDAMREDAKESGTFDKDRIWIWPPPERVGLEFDPIEQDTIRAIVEGSAAERAGLRAGDHVLTFDNRNIATITDIQAVLEGSPFDATEIPLMFRREGKLHPATLKLADGWKQGTPYTYSWRAYKWGIDPAPGFGGPQLDAAAKKELGLSEDAFAMRVQYLVTWGERAHTGRTAARAGIRKGDVIVSVDGKTDLRSTQHFHSWVRLKCEPGQTLSIELLRKGRRQSVELQLSK